MVVIAAAICSCSDPGMRAQSSSAPDPLQTLAHDFWQWRARYQPFSGDDIPRIERPGGLRDWSAASIPSQRAALANFETRWKQLDTAGWSVSRQVDYRLMGSALARVHWELYLNPRWERDPTFYLEQTLTPLEELLAEPPPFDADRSREILLRMQNIPELLQEGQHNLDPLRPFARLAIASLEPIAGELTQVAQEVGPMLQSSAGAQGHISEEFRQATDRATIGLNAYREWLRQRLGEMPEETAVGQENYEFFLNQVALLPFTPEQLLNLSRQEWDRAVSFEQYEKQRNQSLSDLKLAVNIDQQIKATEQAELAIRRFLEEKGILTVPPDVQHYTVKRLPGYLAALSSFGEEDDFTGPARLQQNGVRWTPPPSPHLGYFALSAAKDPRPLLVHEGVPGHYFQLCLSWRHEDPIRRHYYDSSANEGLGFYAEEMMLQAGLFDRSPRTREIIYSFMRLRALRVEVDVKLALGWFTMGQAADYLAQHVPMDKQTAEEEAAAFARAPGQAISYQIGKAEILRFLADAKLDQGDKFSLRGFHDFLWKNGNVPITLQRWEYLGKDDELKLIDQRKASSALH
jgi:hypothetical protein